MSERKNLHSINSMKQDGKKNHRGKKFSMTICRERTKNSSFNKFNETGR